MTDLTTLKINAVASGLQQLATNSGYGHFIPPGAYMQWAPKLIELVDQVEQTYGAVPSANPVSPVSAFTADNIPVEMSIDELMGLAGPKR
jgi:hypothetical protein